MGNFVDFGTGVAMSTAVETCPYCSKDIEETDQRSIVLGVTAHESCYRRRQAEKAGPQVDHVPVQDRDGLPQCSICNKDVNPTDAVAYIGGVPQHSECRACQQGEAAEHVRAQDRPNDDNICPKCNKAVQDSDMGSASFIGGRPHHRACMDSGPKADHVPVQNRDGLPQCSICNKDVNPTDA